MSELSPQRKTVVLLCASVACMSGGPILLKGHSRLALVWIGFMVLALVNAMVQLATLKGQER